MDPIAFEAYKNKIGARITRIMGESLLNKTITEDQAREMSNYIMENIDLAKSNIELMDFVAKLSEKWPLFKSILEFPEESQSTAINNQQKTDEIVQKAEELIKENKLDEALEVTKTAEENPVPLPPVNNNQQTGGVV